MWTCTHNSPLTVPRFPFSLPSFSLHHRSLSLSPPPHFYFPRFFLFFPFFFTPPSSFITSRYLRTRPRPTFCSLETAKTQSPSAKSKRYSPPFACLAVPCRVMSSSKTALSVPPPHGSGINETWSFLEQGIDQIMNRLEDGLTYKRYMEIYT